MRARGFGGVPLESRELMLASDFLRGGAAALCKRCEADSVIGNRVIRPLVAQSFAGWPYARSGGPVKTEDDPLDPRPVRSMSAKLAVIRRLEATVTGAHALSVLLFGAQPRREAGHR